MKETKEKKIVFNLTNSYMKITVRQLITVIAIALLVAVGTMTVTSIDRQKKYWRTDHVNQERKVNIEVFEVVSETYRMVTAYNAGDPNQTDDSPCITADNTDICLALALGECSFAANFVPFGTKLQIIGEDFEMLCEVNDRMNSRFPNRVDIAMKLSEKQRALRFKHILLVRVLR